MKGKQIKIFSAALIALSGWLLVLLLPLLLAAPWLPLGAAADARWLLLLLLILWPAAVGGRMGRALYPRWVRAGFLTAGLCLLLGLFTALLLAPALLTPVYAGLLCLVLLPSAWLGALLSSGRILYARRLTERERAIG